MVRYLAVYDAIKSFEKGKTYLFVGRPGVGKTSLLMGLAKNEAQVNKKKILIYNTCEKESDNVFENSIYQHHIENVHFRDIGLCDGLVSFGHRLKLDVAKTHAEMIFIDGIDYFAGCPADSDYSKENYKDTVYFLKNLALEKNVPIIASFRTKNGDDNISFDEQEEYGDGYGFRGIDQTIIMFDVNKGRLGSFDLVKSDSIKNIQADSPVKSVGLHYSWQNWNHYIGWNPKTMEYFDIPKVVYLFGAEDVNYLPQKFVNTIDNYISYGCKFIVGDNPGTDTLAQEYLASIRYKNVEIYSIGDNTGDARVNIGKWPVKLTPSALVTHNGFSLEKNDWQKMDDHDEYVALKSASKDSCFWKIFNPIYFYESFGHIYKCDTGMVRVVDGSGHEQKLQGPLEVYTPNGGQLTVYSEKNEDDICKVKTEAGYFIELGRKTWGYEIPDSENYYGTDYMDLIHGDDWGNKTIENDFPPFTYSRSACKEDCVMVSIDMIMKFPYLVDTDKMKELLDIAYYLKVCSCIDPIVISIDEAGRYKVLSGQKTIMACMIAGIKEVPCRIIGDRRSVKESV